MAKLLICFTVTCLLIALAMADCPSYSKVTSCSPKCVQDSECSSINGKCCSNLCNAKSCVRPGQYGDDGKSSSSKYGSGGTGSYCGNVKCNPYEKCDMDKSTKRPKCVRA